MFRIRKMMNYMFKTEPQNQEEKTLFKLLSDLIAAAKLEVNQSQYNQEEWGQLVHHVTLVHVLANKPSPDTKSMAEILNEAQVCYLNLKPDILAMSQDVQEIFPSFETKLLADKALYLNQLKPSR